MISHPKLVAHILNAGLVGLFALGCVVLATSEGSADSTDFLRAFQKNQLPSQQLINASYVNFTYTPFKRNDLAFKLLIPKGWRDIPVSVPAEMIAQDSRRMIPVAEQRSPGTGNDEAAIQVAYTRMDVERSLHDLIDQYLKENKIEVLMRRQGSYNQRKIDEVLIRSETDSTPFLSRMTFSRDGDRVFVVSGSAHESQFSRYAQSFAVAAVSFMVQQKASNPYAVGMVSFTSSRTPTLKFNYPKEKEWEIEELQHLPAGQAGVDLKLVVRGEKKEQVTTYGYIHVRGISKKTAETPQQTLDNLKKDFENMRISYQQCTLRADLMPSQPSPLGKLEKWDVIAGDVPGETAFWVLPYRSDFLALGLFCMRPEDNLVSWQHVWRVFEIVAKDLTGKDMDVAKIKNHVLPSSSELTRLTTATMTDFAAAAQAQDFNVFHADLSTTLQLQATPDKLLQAFRGFGNLDELATLNQLDPVLENEVCLNKDGLLKLNGHFPTRPQATTFGLTYVDEKAEWKLLSINVSMKKMPPAVASRAPAPSAPSDTPLSDKTNVLAAENGGQVISCSSQYNSTSWGARNLIDGQLGSNHGYASRNLEPAEIVFSLSKTETLSQLCFNPYTTESPQTWAQRVQVEVSTQGSNAGFQPVGEYPLHNQRSQDQQTPLPDQCFDIGEVQARYIKLRLLSNHGGGYIELGEFKAYAAAK